MDLELKDKVVLVTGGNSGLGLATALAFAQEGAKVVIAARDVAKSEAAIEQIKAAGSGECMYLKTDVTKYDEVVAMVQKTVDKYGRLDCAVNNAGYHSQFLFADLEESEWDYTTNLNLKAVWMCMKYEIRAMLKNGGGAIVNVASTAGVRGFRNLTPYVAAKHGVVGMAKTATIEYARQGIRVNTICPGQFRTAMLDDAYATDPVSTQKVADATPMGRFGDPEEFGNAVAWLCSPRAGYIAGVALGIDGGLGQH
jgi:NAD(P)-dependent dehydrogenase (short-subunit alcohol dehydrogenase family)